MKFGKSLIRVVELSDPEWGPYWVNYKFLKKKINDIVTAQGGVKVKSDRVGATHPKEIAKLASEVDFFVLLKSELKKTSDFFASTEQLYLIRKARVWEAFRMLKEGGGVVHDKNTWTRLLMACVNFYKDVLLLENFAIMSYCAYSKILKKHDKQTGFRTRDAYMRNVVSQQNFTHYPHVLALLTQSEALFADIQDMESVMPLQDEERLFIEAIRDLNYQASRLSEERSASEAKTTTGAASGGSIPAVVTEAALCGQSSAPQPAAAQAVSVKESADKNGAFGGQDSERSSEVACAGARSKRKATSFNPYHGPSFITAIPDSSTPYISGMCVVDPGDRLDAATSLVIDAAMRLNHTSAAAKPNLHSIVAWVNGPAATAANVPGGERAVPAVSGTHRSCGAATGAQSASSSKPVSPSTVSFGNCNAHAASHQQKQQQLQQLQQRQQQHQQRQLLQPAQQLRVNIVQQVAPFATSHNSLLVGPDAHAGKARKLL